ncbi:MAG: RnfABCDGE type electron transport complex subunit B [Gammaproteobacteria bacterium]|nr:RnfABCDGE type electron transport complex subunit B [Gammaproteobacteria bacterium]MYF31666.1 RnfABCDGE type electron transport complex subunit B [Gammaproteobacteria bacterium]MYK46530.1 RnfABCDGE type electron transport complex subunit B [Gammaproteobacteria bacterium]
MTAALVLGGIGLAVAVLLSLARRALVRKEDANAGAVVVAIVAVLPQSQCAQCGYPGCRPYAEAVAAGERLDLCPPGGTRVVAALEELLGRDADTEMSEPVDAVARIVEADCIGCALCIDACPVDAIAGASKYLHAVIPERCTGCELCIPACPVDCIELVARSGEVTDPPAPANAAALPCIGCGRCEGACPVDLKPEMLHVAFETGATDTSVTDCIECTACTRACPSGIDLVGEFGALKHRLQGERETNRRADNARRHSDARNERLARQAREQAAHRAERLRAPHQWQ